jgi:dTDP-4-amino-4,6-dideoxygalactose transaminase
MINIYEPSLGKEEIAAIEDVFKSNWLGYGRNGTKQDEFVEKFSSKILIDGAHGVCSVPVSPQNLTTISCCSEALFQAVNAYVTEGDEVIMPTISFVAAANAVIAKKAKPVFCDVDKRTLNPTVADIEKCITTKTKAVIILHYAGLPCDIENIAELCAQKKIILIEDNASSPFSRVGNKNTGTFGDMGLWSFDPMKVITTGDGGMIYCKDMSVLQHIKYNTYLGLKSSGSTNPVDNKWWEFNVECPGSKATMNDLTAAIGISQLSKVEQFLATRKLVHNTYNKALSDLSWLDIPNPISEYITSSYYMYHIQLKKSEHRNKLSRYLRDRGIYTTFRYYPLHLVKYYDASVKLPNAEWAANHTLNLPLHQSLTQEDVTHVIKCIKEFRYED